MSNVRLSNVSPTVERERVEARQPEPSKPPVRRNLFASEHRSREEQTTELEGKMHDAEKAFIERWNYDISNDRPLSPGNCQWEAVKSSEVPPFYSRPPHKRGYPRGELDLNGNDDQRSSAVTGSQLTEDTDSCAGHTGRSSPSHGSRRRPGCPSSDSPTLKRSHKSEEEDDDVSESEATEVSDSSSGEEDLDVSAAPEKTPGRPDGS